MPLILIYIYNEGMEKADRFVQVYLETIEVLRQKQGLSHSDIARAAFPLQQDPVGTYRKVRNSGRGLKLTDACRLAQAVQQDFAALCWQVSQSLLPRM